PEKGIKSVDVLNKIKEKLRNQGVQLFVQHEFVGFDNNRHVTFKNQGQEVVVEADYILFALGGASWPVTGSDGSWRAIFESMGIATLPFQSSNCGMNIRWPETVSQSHAGKPIKNIRLFAGNIEVKGEMIVTKYGIEGNAVYPLVPSIRDMLNANAPATLYIDFKPLNTGEQLLSKTQGKDVRTKDYGKIFNLNTAQLAILKAFTDKETFLSVSRFIQSMKKLAIPIDSLRPVEEAISTIGGISLEELNDDFSLKKYPWIYTIGEMVDWDAPTGGYLLQGSFSMGHYAGKAIMERM
ncbi:MAG: TIGR03862 family flavoprotein, partial [Bacteroidota bacterium]|nr:TIGR03862 family flavoprotein [Bacteroidota bacterium]